MYSIKDEERAAPDGFRLLMKDVGRTDLLTAQEDRELAEAAALGDRPARDRMIQANLRLVVRIARDFTGRGMSLDDLIGEGILGLVRAVDGYDPRREVRFCTYAGHWIKEGIRAALMNTTATIRIPAHMFKLMARWRQAERLLRRRDGAAPSFDEVASHLGLTGRQREMVRSAQRSSQFAPTGGMHGAEGQAGLPEPADGRPGPGAEIEMREQLDSLASRMGRLDEREAAILNARFGMGGEVRSTLREVGGRIGLTAQWVSKLERQALAKLRLEPVMRARASDPSGTGLHFAPPRERPH